MKELPQNFSRADWCPKVRYTSEFYRRSFTSERGTPTDENLSPALGKRYLLLVYVDCRLLIIVYVSGHDVLRTKKGIRINIYHVAQGAGLPSILPSVSTFADLANSRA